MDEHEYEERPEGYVVPTYWGDDQTTWYHFLHGNVPGHQIDFMYRPEVPQGYLTRQHFSHLSRLMKYIEPQTNSQYAFCIGNLSRDDTQYEPGRGGLGMIFGFRIRGVTDHAGRQDPPFAHGIAAVSRRMDYSGVLSSALSFFQHLFGKGEYDNPASQLYRDYVRYAVENPSLLEYVLRTYTADFAVLPEPDPSSLSLRWLTNEAPQPKRIVIVHPNSAPFGAVAECAAKIAAVLYQSDIRWTCITTGRESDLPGGVTVRLVARRDAGAYESGGPVMSIDDVPDDEEELAQKLFGAQRVGVPEAAAPVRGWREQYRSQPGSQSNPPPPRSEPRPPSGSAGNGFDGSRGAAGSDSQQALWESRTGNAAGDGGYIEPPKAWGQSAKLSPDELRAAMGLPPLPKTEVAPAAVVKAIEPPPVKPAPMPATKGATPLPAKAPMPAPMPAATATMPMAPLETAPARVEAPVKAAPAPIAAVEKAAFRPPPPPKAPAVPAPATPQAPTVSRTPATAPVQEVAPTIPAARAADPGSSANLAESPDMGYEPLRRGGSSEQSGSKKWVWIGLAAVCVVLVPVGYFVFLNGATPGGKGSSGEPPTIGASATAQLTAAPPEPAQPPTPTAAPTEPAHPATSGAPEVTARSAPPSPPKRQRPIVTADTVIIPPPPIAKPKETGTKPKPQPSDSVFNPKNPKALDLND